MTRHVHWLAADAPPGQVAITFIDGNVDLLLTAQTIEFFVEAQALHCIACMHAAVMQAKKGSCPCPALKLLQ